MVADALAPCVAKGISIHNQVGNNPDRGMSTDLGTAPIEVRYTSNGDGLSGSRLLQENTYFSEITATVIGRDA